MIVNFEYMGVPMASLEANGKAVRLVVASDKCRARFERFLAEGVRFPEHSKHAKFNVGPPTTGEVEGEAFLRSVAEAVKVLFGVKAQFLDALKPVDRNNDLVIRMPGSEFGDVSRGGGW